MFDLHRQPATHLSGPLGGSVRGRAEALYQPILRQRDANRVGNIETNGPQLHHGTTIDKHHPLDTMRLRIVEANNITSPKRTSCDHVHGHGASVWGRRAAPATDSATAAQRKR
jgi:hypothetical protein